MIRKVTAHLYEIARKCWRVNLACGHVLYVEKADHSRIVKGRFCPSCPGAHRAMMADLRNENAREYEAYVERLRTRVDKS